jgi:GMP synthase (glutamine-hydrolysing)
MAALPKLVLLQARKAEDPELEGERRVFAHRLGVPDERVSSHNMVESVPDLRELRAHDAILVGGSGDYYVSNGQFPDQERLLEVLADAADGSTPIFASCFGFHLLTAALGGEIVHDPARIELGTYRVELTEAGREDELFGTLPPSFLAQLGRKDRATRLPPGAAHLARSERCPMQAFRLGDRPIWATQFHPELDAKTNRRRYMVYLESYESYLDEEARVNVASRFRESPATEELLRRFLSIVLDA